MKCHRGKRWRRETTLAAGSPGRADDGALAGRDTKATVRRNENRGFGPDMLPPVAATSTKQSHLPPRLQKSVMFFISACLPPVLLMVLRPYMAGKVLRKRVSHENVG